MTDVLMPLLGEGMEEGTIARWLVASGDVVAADDEIAEIETDKVTTACVAGVDGAIEILVAEGDTVAVGAPIARIGAAVPAAEGAAGNGAAPAVAEPAVEATAPPVVAAPVASAAAGSSVRATPLARLVAARHGVDLAGVTGTGPGGLVTRRDLGLGLPDPAPTRRAPAPVARTSTVVIPEGATVVEPTRAQRVVAERMTEAKAMVPEFQVQTDVWMDALLAVREDAKAIRGDAPSINDFVVRAAALALREHPLANGFWADGRIVLLPDVHVGVAVAAEGTLMVPVVRHADRLDVTAIAAETRRLAEAVRAGTVTADELRGGTFTVSNLGMFGMTAITPILNLPQAAILGVGAARETVRFEGDRPVRAHVATLSLTCDHRILYGADAARFLARVRELLERPVALLLD